MNISYLGTIALLTLKRVWNSKFALCTIVIAPVVLCITFGYVAYKSPERISALVMTEDLEQRLWDKRTWQIVDEICYYRTDDGSTPFSVTTEIGSLTEARQRLDDGRTRAVIVLKQEKDDVQSAEVIVDVTEPSVSNQFEQELPIIFDKYSRNISVRLITDFLIQLRHLPRDMASAKASEVLIPFEVKHETNSWKELKFFDFFASAAIVLIALGLPLFLSSISITNERSVGTLERVFASPYKKSEIIIGKMLANSILGIVITILIMITLKAVFNATLGNIGLILMLTTLVAINGVIFGLLVSAMTYSETESLLVSVLFLLLVMLQMTYLWPWETMHYIAKYFSYLIPYTYGFQAIRHVNMVGAGFADVWLDLLILLGFVVAQALIAIQILRRRIA